MSNLQRNNHKYSGIIKGLDSLARGDSVEGIEKLIDKAYVLFVGDYIPSDEHTSENDFTNQVINNLIKYTDLLKNRRRVIVAEAEREATTEEEALNSLVLANTLAKELLIPFYSNSSQLSNRIFRDISNLSLSYLDSIVDGVADEYIGANLSLEVKSEGVDIAKQGIRVGDNYSHEGFSKKTKSEFKRFQAMISILRPNLMRSFEMVFTKPKEVYKVKEYTDKLINDVLAVDQNNQLIFPSDIIFPVAHGGTEVGIRIANAFEDKLDYDPIVYPLMFSMKTRKQRYPWVQNDSEFLQKSLEGKNVLIVEDWVTTGNTVRGILNKIESVFPREIRVATLKRDPIKSRVPILDNYIFYVGTNANYPGAKLDSFPGVYL